MIGVVLIVLMKRLLLWKLLLALCEDGVEWNRVGGLECEEVD